MLGRVGVYSNLHTQANHRIIKTRVGRLHGEAICKYRYNVNTEMGAYSEMGAYTEMGAYSGLHSIIVFF